MTMLVLLKMSHCILFFFKYNGHNNDSMLNVLLKLK